MLAIIVSELLKTLQPSSEEKPMTVRL